MALYTWGHNNAQQLGLGTDDKVVFDVHRVDALAREYVTDVAAGEQHTLAVNEFGDVFAWGRGKEGQLGLGPDVTAACEPTRVALGGLDGHCVAQVACGDAHSVARSADGRVFMWGLLPAAVGRADAPGDALGDAHDRATVSLAGLYEDSPALSPRSLRASMSDSLMARLVRDSMLVYETEALGAAGGGPEAPEGGPAAGKTRTIRRPVFSPRPSAALAGVRVASIAAGFAHSLAVSDAGAVFSCGYNDSGQLGLGSRRNAPDFTLVRALRGRRVARVACGQQHSLACCARDAADADADGACFAWGLGMLGQLGTGLGVAVAYLPVRVPVPAPVTAVAAGAHHSVAVTAAGAVFTWGHSEYGQHGAHASHGGDDLQRRANYMLPHEQPPLADDELDDRRWAVSAVACSAHSTFAIATAADGAARLFSWGWNAFGVLGNGKVQRTARPQRVFALGDRAAERVAAGANHGAVVLRPRGCHYAMRMDVVLARADFADVRVEAQAPGAGAGDAPLRAHRVVLAARSPYLRGYLRAAAGAAVAVAVAAGEAGEDAGPLVLDAFRDADAAVVRALLVFLYTGRVAVAVHKRRALAALAARVHCEELAAACADPWRSAERERERERAGDKDAEGDARRADSPFVRAMQAALESGELADVEFLWPGEGGGAPAARIPAHKAVLAQVEYFRSMFLGGFSEAAAAGARHEVPLLFMPRDGVTLAAFRRLLLWVYTGCFSLLLGDGGPAEAMDLLVAASLLNLRELEAQCERQLLEWLPRLREDDADSLRACRDFGARFGARKLEAMSARLLRAAGVEDEDEGEDEGEGESESAQ